MILLDIPGSLVVAGGGGGGTDEGVTIEVDVLCEVVVEEVGEDEDEEVDLLVEVEEEEEELEVDEEVDLDVGVEIVVDVDDECVVLVDVGGRDEVVGVVVFGGAGDELLLI